MNSFQAIVWEIQKSFFPRSAVRVLLHRFEVEGQVDPLDDSRMLLELYVRLGELSLAKQEYDCIIAMLQFNGNCPNKSGDKYLCIALACVANYEKTVLGNYDLAVKTAKHAHTISVTRGFAPVMELLKHDFPELFKSPLKPKTS